MTYTHYTGQRGDDYQDTETYTETDADGNTVTKTRTVTERLAGPGSPARCSTSSTTCSSAHRRACRTS